MSVKKITEVSTTSEFKDTDKFYVEQDGVLKRASKFAFGTEVGKLIAGKADQAALNTAVSNLNTEIGKKANANTVSSLSTKVDGLETTLDTKVGELEATLGTKADSSTVEGVSGRVSTLETNIETKANQSALNELSGEVDSLSDAIDETSAKIPPLDARVTYLEEHGGGGGGGAVNVDPTFTKLGYAADAKLTGDRFVQVESSALRYDENNKVTKVISGLMGDGPADIELDQETRFAVIRSSGTGGGGGGAVNIDPTFTKEGYAADAKLTGDRFTVMESSALKFDEESKNLKVISGGYGGTVDIDYDEDTQFGILKSDGSGGGGTAVNIDETFTKRGYAADSKLTGDRFTELETSVLEFNEDTQELNVVALGNGKSLEIKANDETGYVEITGESGVIPPDSESVKTAVDAYLADGIGSKVDELESGLTSLSGRFVYVESLTPTVVGESNEVAYPNGFNKYNCFILGAQISLYGRYYESYPFGFGANLSDNAVVIDSYSDADTRFLNKPIKVMLYKYA